MCICFFHHPPPGAIKTTTSGGRAIKGHKYALVLAFNRDEYLSRATLPVHRWDNGDDDQIIAGRDVDGGGTWLGINARDGRYAFLTNVRDMSSLSRKWKDEGMRSRGELVIDFLTSRDRTGGGMVRDHVEARVVPHARSYPGFNLVCGRLFMSLSNEDAMNGDDIIYVGNKIDDDSVPAIKVRDIYTIAAERQRPHREADPVPRSGKDLSAPRSGEAAVDDDQTMDEMKNANKEEEEEDGDCCWGLSNGRSMVRSKEWPKVECGVRSFRDIISHHCCDHQNDHGGQGDLEQDRLRRSEDEMIDALLDLMRDKTTHEQHEPRVLSGICLPAIPVPGSGGTTTTTTSKPMYGTRSHTIVVVGIDGRGRMIEVETHVLERKEGREREGDGDGQWVPRETRREVGFLCATGES